MTKPEALVTIFDDWLDEASRRELLTEANIGDDRPSLLRGKGGSYDEACSWMQAHRERITPLIFRFLDPPDRLVTRLVAEGDLIVPQVEKEKPRYLTFSRLTDSLNYETESIDEFSVLDLSLSSAFISELFIEVARANHVCGARVEPPRATISAGSVKYTLGGGLFASGMGLLVACAAGLVGAPVVGPVAGATLATVGLFDLALGWRKQVAETTKINSDARKADADTRLADLEVKIKQLELEKAQLLSETQPEYDPRMEVLRLYVRRTQEMRYPKFSPESSEVPRKLVCKTADSFNMT